MGRWRGDRRVHPGRRRERLARSLERPPGGRRERDAQCSDKLAVTKRALDLGRLSRYGHTALWRIGIVVARRRGFVVSPPRRAAILLATAGMFAFASKHLPVSGRPA